jgi:hypothetical protein
MQANYRLVHGEDVLKDLIFRPTEVRIQCERELKGKALRLRQVYLESREKPRALREIIAGSITAFTSIFQGLLYLAGKPIPRTKEEIIKEVAEGFQLDVGVFLKLLAVKRGQIKASGPELAGLFKEYVSQIDALSGMVDQLSLEEKEGKT